MNGYIYAKVANWVVVDMQVINPVDIAQYADMILVTQDVTEYTPITIGWLWDGNQFTEPEKEEYNEAE